MNKMIFYVYKSKFTLLWGLFLIGGWFYFLTSQCTLDNWLISTNYIHLYLNVIYFLLIIHRVKIYKSMRKLTVIRIGENTYFNELFKVGVINIMIYLCVVYFPLFILSIGVIQSYKNMGIYFAIILIQFLVIEQINLFVIFKDKSSLYLNLSLLVNFFFKFVIIEPLFHS